MSRLDILRELREEKGFTQIQVVNDLNKIYGNSPEKYANRAFNLNLDFQSDLSNGKVSAKLKKVFEDKRFQLSEAGLGAGIEQNDDGWFIYDGDRNKKYVIRREGGWLQVYWYREITLASYGNWERGNREPSLDRLRLIADYYQVSTDYLLGRSGRRQGMPHFVLDELGLIPPPWWKIEKEATSDERACAKVFVWIASGEDEKKVLARKDDEDWRDSRWGNRPNIDTVQAMLIRAVHDGIIGIIADEIPRNIKLIESVKSKFPFLQEVDVVESLESKLLSKILVGEAAASCFSRIVRPGQKVGLSGGTNLSFMAVALRKYPCLGNKFSPFENGLVPESVAVCSNTNIGIIKLFHEGEDIEAYAFQYFGFDHTSRKPGKFPPNHPDVIRVFDYTMDISVGFVGFGAITGDTDQGQSTFTDPAFGRLLEYIGITVEDLINDNVVGDILYHCIDQDGMVVDNNLNRRIVSMSPEILREMCKNGKQIVAISSGAQKGKAGLALLKRQYFNNIVIDSDLAGELCPESEIS